MIIDQLPEISSVQTTDEMPVERGQTSYKTPISKIFASPTLTGTPKAPTADVSTNNTQIATTAFANRAANNAVSTFARPNLLDNWYFVGGGSQLGSGVFPINQRGQTSYTDSATGAIYTINRWRIATPARSLSINSDSISVIRNTADTGWSSFSQYIGNKDALKGKTLTLSALVKNDNAAVYPWITLRSDAGNIASVSEASAHSEWTLLQATGTAGDSLNNLRIEVYPGPAVSAQGASIKIKAIKLEIGSEQTLAHQENGAWVLNEIPDYETELVKCKTSKADPNDTYANNIIGYNVSHRNLLDNWYFVGGGSQLGYGVFPINQRGQTSYSNIGYSIDRWKKESNDGSVVIAANGVTISGQTARYIAQPVNGNNIYGKTITISALFTDGTLVAGSGILPVDAVSQRVSIPATTYDNTIVSCYKTPENKCAVQIFTNKPGDVTLAAIKLELGSEQTIAHQENGAWVLNEIPDYGQELLKCQRYFQIFRTQSLRPTYGIDFRPVMATDTPTLASFTKDGVTYYTASSE